MDTGKKYRNDYEYHQCGYEPNYDRKCIYSSQFVGKVGLIFNDWVELSSIQNQKHWKFKA